MCHGKRGGALARVLGVSTHSGKDYLTVPALMTFGTAVFPELWSPKSWTLHLL